MNIELVRSCFSRSNEGILVRVRSDGATIDDCICKEELLSFAEMLMDIADGALHKYGDEKYDNAREHLSKAMEALQ